jgi:hypothetical protein
MYDMVLKVDKLRGSEKEKISSQVDALHQHISDMEHIIDQLQTECPVEFGPQKKQIEESAAGMKKNTKMQWLPFFNSKEITSIWSREP